MFRVEAQSLADYLNFDPARKADLAKLHALLRTQAPRLKRYFHKGTPAGEPGMRFKMIGYGKFHYASKSGARVEWPVIGVALQKNYISVYISLTKAGKPLVAQHAAKLNALRAARYNFSFAHIGDLNEKAASALFADAAHIVAADPQNPVRCKERA